LEDKRVRSSLGSRHKKQRTEAETAGVVGTGVGAVDVAVSEREAFLQSMVKGEVNPHKQVQPPPAAQADAQKLSALLTLLQNCACNSFFSEVKLTSGGDKLLFRGLPKKQYLVSEGLVTLKGTTAKACKEAPEAFCFVVFGEGGQLGDQGPGERHEASVQCENDGFRAAVLQALASVN